MGADSSCNTKTPAQGSIRSAICPTPADSFTPLPKILRTTRVSPSPPTARPSLPCRTKDSSRFMRFRRPVLAAILPLPQSLSSNKTTVLSDASIGAVAACPDGRTILLSLNSRDVLGSINTWKIGTDGSNLKQLSKGRQEYAEECSPDSKWAYFTDNEGNRVQRAAIDGGAPETV